jgi:putative phage-type endonuclease
MLTPEQIAKRKHSIGASEVAAILGISPWDKPVDVWMRKVGLADEFAGNAATARGNYLERGLLAWLGDTVGLEFNPVESRAHADYPFITATPDGLAQDADGKLVVAEVKSPGPRTAHHWGDGDDGAPVYYLAQVAQQMLVTGADYAYLAGLVHGELVHYRIERDAENDALITSACVSFWERHVITKEPPPVDAAPAWLDYAQKRFGPGGAERITASDEAEILAREYLTAKQEIAAIESRLDEIKNRLALECGEFGGIQGQGWRLNYTTPKASSSFDVKWAMAEGALTEDIFKKFSKERAASRRFDLRAIKDGAK